MRYSKPLTIAASLLLTLLSAGSALADAGVSCGPNGPEEDHIYDNRYPNPLSLTEAECRDLCQISEYCKMYKDNQREVFGGIWRYNDSNWHSHMENDCITVCNEQQAACAPNDQACLAQFIPEDVNCDLLQNEEDRDYCQNKCQDEYYKILTSECGRSCLQNGIEGKTHDYGCRDVDEYCMNLGATDAYYCKAIPLEYSTKWSIFGILMGFLACFSGIILIVLHRQKTESDNKNA